MKTERAYIVEKEDADEGIFVGHVYYPLDSSFRRTDFYLCSNEASAENLVEALQRDVGETR